MPGLEWPQEKVDRRRVEEWIAAFLRGQHGSARLVEVYHTKDWGLVARFRLASNPARDVVFKMCALDAYAAGPLFYELLNRCCRENVPTLLAWTKVDGQTWTLFEPFAGESVAKTSTLQLLTNIARSLADIQTKVADLPRSALSHLPHVDVTEIPGRLDGAIQYVAEKYSAHWSREEGPFSEIMPKLPEVLRGLATFHTSLEKWVTELSMGGWPNTIDHTDLHANNAVVRPDGRILIFDWEESLIAMPFFSMDELLGRVRALDRQRLQSNQHANSSYTIGPWEQTVRDAYLDAIPWGKREDRERALDLALCLSPIRKVDEYMRSIAQLGRPKGNRYLAVIFTDALHRWQNMKASNCA